MTNCDLCGKGENDVLLPVGEMGKHICDSCLVTALGKKARNAPVAKLVAKLLPSDLGWFQKIARVAVLLLLFGVLGGVLWVAR